MSTATTNAADKKDFATVDEDEDVLGYFFQNITKLDPIPSQNSSQPGTNSISDESTKQNDKYPENRLFGRFVAVYDDIGRLFEKEKWLEKAKEVCELSNLVVKIGEKVQKQNAKPGEKEQKQNGSTVGETGTNSEQNVQNQNAQPGENDVISTVEGKGTTPGKNAQPRDGGTSPVPRVLNSVWYHWLFNSPKYSLFVEPQNTTQSLSGWKNAEVYKKFKQMFAGSELPKRGFFASSSHGRVVMFLAIFLAAILVLLFCFPIR